MRNSSRICEASASPLDATPRQKVVSLIFAGRDRTRLRTEKNLLDILDRIHELSHLHIDSTHIFPLSQVFEGLLLRMGQKNNDGGQFFTPREIIRAMIRTVEPRLGRTIYDPCCGTGGFLAQTYEFLCEQNPGMTPQQFEFLKLRTFFGREADDTAFPIGLANLVLHGIDTPRLWHGNALSGAIVNGDLFTEVPPQFDYLLTNPPFGGKEGMDAQQKFDFRTSSTSVLFLQHVIDSLAHGGTCGMVIDEGALFRTNEKAYVETKRWLLESCDLWCIVSMPGGVFVNAGAGVKTNLLFFSKGRPTERIWYYDLSHVKVNKGTPFTLDKFDDFFSRLQAIRQSDGTLNFSAPQANSERSWVVHMKDILAKNFDLKAVNPNAPDTSDKRTPAELLAIIEGAQQEIVAGLHALRERSGRDSGW